MGTAIQRKTMRVREGVDAPTDSSGKPIKSDARWLYDPDLSAVAGVPKKHWRIVGDAVVALPVAEQLASEQRVRRLSIAGTTRVALRIGQFDHDGTKLRLTVEERVAISVLASDAPSNFSPLALHAEDGSALVISTHAELQAVFKSMASWYRGVLGAAHDAVVSIDGAATPAEAAAVRDPRKGTQ